MRALLHYVTDEPHWRPRTLRKDVEPAAGASKKHLFASFLSQNDFLHGALSARVLLFLSSEIKSKCRSSGGI